MTAIRRLSVPLFALLLVLFACQLRAQDFAAIPPLTAHVTDSAGMLNASQRAALENVLTEYEQRSGSQIAVLLVSSTAPEAIEQYSIRVADQWKLGRKGVDDGVILVVAKDNPASLRRLRIEAGRGVQGSLTDAQSKRILQDIIAPHFRQNDYYGGLAAGVSAIASLIDKENLAKPAGQAQNTGRQEAESGGGWLPLLIMAFIVMSMLRSRGGRRRGQLSSNGWGTAAGIILGSQLGRRGGFGGGGGGGFGGGGFSGGGGGFDGGGASGDW